MRELYWMRNEKALYQKEEGFLTLQYILLGGMSRQQCLPTITVFLISSAQNGQSLVSSFFHC